jgi:RecA/RadA recombinase
MAKEKQKENQIEQLLSSKEFEGKHFGSRSGTDFDDSVKITTGSLFFDQIMGGGYRSSSWGRFYGEIESGKTSIMLLWGKHWQDKFPDNGKVVLFNAEGRLTKDIVERSGINVSPEKFCIIDMNCADTIFSFIEKLVDNNPEEIRYYFAIDSTDACQRSVDKDKSLGESEKIGGSATIHSAAGKRLSLPFNRKGHFLLLLSQLRDKLNTYSPGAPSKDASGGNAPRFYSSFIGQVQKPWTDTFIYENPSDTKSKRVGVLATIKLIKTYNETTGQIVQYPIKYGKGGIWQAYEAMMVCQVWSFYRKSGAWWKIDETFAEELKANNIKFEESFQGEKNMRDSFDTNFELVDYIYKKMYKLIK